jgi:spore coat polysaccharide biosynthesis protein SpsF
MSSTRLPGKAMLQINGEPMISWQISRILKSNVDGLVLVTSTEESDNTLTEYVNSLGVPVYRGSIENVFSRFWNVLETYKPERFLRLTGDCPLVMPNLINEMLTDFEKFACDYMSNTNPPTFPDGLDIEIASFATLEKLSKLELTADEKEHVTIGIYNRPTEFNLRNFSAPYDNSNMRWTVDYPEDLEFVRRVYNQFIGSENDFAFEDVVQLIKSNIIQDNVLTNQLRNITLKSIRPEEF